MLNKETAQQYIQEKVIALYSQLQQGKDVSPGERLRLEGQAELLLQFQLIDWHWLQTWIPQQYQLHFQQAIAGNIWQWMQEEQRFYLPINMHDAPVYKG